MNPIKHAQKKADDKAKAEECERVNGGLSRSPTTRGGARTASAARPRRAWAPRRDTRATA